MLSVLLFSIVFFFFTVPATTEIYTLSLHDALPILDGTDPDAIAAAFAWAAERARSGLGPTLIELVALRICGHRSEEHTSELQSLRHLVCRLLLEKKKKRHISTP